MTTRQIRALAPANTFAAARTRFRSTSKRVTVVAVAIAALVAPATAATLALLARPAGAAQGDILTVAGDGLGNFHGDGVAATDAGIDPAGVAVDAQGNQLIADSSNAYLWVVASSVSNPGYRLGASCAGPCVWHVGDIYSIAGIGTYGYNGDGIAATAAQVRPASVALDAAGNPVVVDFGRLRIVAMSASNPGYTLTGCAGVCTWTVGDIYTLAGDGTIGYTGDGIPATTAEISGFTLSVDAANDPIITESTRVRVVAVSASNPGYPLAGCAGSCTWSVGNIYTIAGNGSGGYTGDGISAVAAEIEPESTAIDAHGNPFITDTFNGRVRVVAVSASNPGYPLAGCAGSCTWSVGDIYTIAGDGSFAYNGDGIPAPTAGVVPIGRPAVDSTGNVLIPDDNAFVRILAVSGANPGYPLAGCAGSCTWSVGNIYTIAGTGTDGYNGDGIASTSAELHNPQDIAVDSFGNVYIADESNDRLREIAVDPNSVLQIAATNSPLGPSVTAGADAAWTTTIYNSSPIAATGITVRFAVATSGAATVPMDESAINLALGLPPATPTCAPFGSTAEVCNIPDVPPKSSAMFTTFVKTAGLAPGTTMSGLLAVFATNGNSAVQSLSTVTVIACTTGCTTGAIPPGGTISSPTPTPAKPTQQILTLPSANAAPHVVVPNTSGTATLSPINVTLSSIVPTAATAASDHKLCPITPNSTHCSGQISSVIGAFGQFTSRVTPIRATIVARWGKTIPAGQILMEKSAGGDPLFLLACVKSTTTLQYNTPCRLPETVTGTASAGTLTTHDPILFTGLDVHFARRVSTGATVIHAPGAPTAVTATAGAASVKLTWKAPTVTNGAGVTSYVVTVMVGTVVKKTVTYNLPALTQVVTGLTKNTSYTFKVAAKNVAGLGPKSDASRAVKPT